MVPASDAESLTLDAMAFSDNSNVKLLSKGKDAIEIMAVLSAYVFESKLN